MPGLFDVEPVIAVDWQQQSFHFRSRKCENEFATENCIGSPSSGGLERDALGISEFLPLGLNESCRTDDPSGHNCVGPDAFGWSPTDPVLGTGPPPVPPLPASV